MKTLWFGVNNGSTVFGHNENDLTTAGVTNPQSFTISDTGEVDGIDYLPTVEQQQVGAQPAVQQG